MRLSNRPTSPRDLNGRDRQRCLGSLGFTAILSVIIAGPASAQWTPPDSYDHPQRAQVTLNASEVTGLQDHSDLFETKIDEVHQHTFTVGGETKRGGQLKVVGPGVFRVREVDLKSHVHIIFENCTIRPYINDDHTDPADSDGNTGTDRTDGDMKKNGTDYVEDDMVPDTVSVTRYITKDVSMFRLGKTGPISDVSLRSSAGNRSTFEMTGYRNDVSYRVQAISCLDVDNFMIQFFDFQNKQSNPNDMGNKFKRASIGMSWRLTSVGGIPRNGTIRHIRSEDAHYGYGTVQAQAGNNIVFKDLYSTGGVTLRLETDYIPMTLANEGGLENITALDITNEDGQSALKLTPHAKVNGEVTATDITAIGSEYAVEIAPGSIHNYENDYTEEELEQLGIAKGRFDKVTINGITATYSDGPLTTQFGRLKHFPVEFHIDIDTQDRVKRDGSRYPKFHGASIAPVVIKFVPNTFPDYEIVINNQPITTTTPTAEDLTVSPPLLIDTSGEHFQYHNDIIYPGDFYQGNPKDVVDGY